MLLLALLIPFLGISQAAPNGAPAEACVDMVPQHFVPPQTTEPPYTLLVANSTDGCRFFGKLCDNIAQLCNITTLIITDSVLNNSHNHLSRDYGYHRRIPAVNVHSDKILRRCVNILIRYFVPLVMFLCRHALCGMDQVSSDRLRPDSVNDLTPYVESVTRSRKFRQGKLLSASYY